MQSKVDVYKRKLFKLKWKINHSMCNLSLEQNPSNVNCGRVYLNIKSLDTENASRKYFKEKEEKNIRKLQVILQTAM